MFIKVFAQELFELFDSCSRESRIGVKRKLYRYSKNFPESYLLWSVVCKTEYDAKRRGRNLQQKNKKIEKYITEPYSGGISIK